MAPSEPLTPVAIEQKLRELVNQMAHSQKALEQARNAETDAWVLLEKAKVLAAESESCPKVERGSVTVADREAWIAGQVLQETIDHRRASTARDIAQDALRTTRDIASVVQSLGQSVRTAYSVAGVAS